MATDDYSLASVSKYAPSPVEATQASSNDPYTTEAVSKYSPVQPASQSKLAEPQPTILPSQQPSQQPQTSDLHRLLPEELPKKSEPFTVGWVMDAITAPGTLIGKLFEPPQATLTPGQKLEAYQAKYSGQPVMGNRPLFDFSTSMENSPAKGVIQAISSFTAPNQLPWLAAPESKAISGLFAASTVPQLMGQYEQYKQQESNHDPAAQNTLGQMFATFVLGSMATSHVAGSKPLDLKPEDRAYATSLVEQHLEEGLRENDPVKVDEAVGGLASLQEHNHAIDNSRLATEQTKENIPPGLTEHPNGQVYAPSPEGIQPSEAQISSEANLRSTSGGPSGEGTTGAASISSPESLRDGGQANEGSPNLIPTSAQLDAKASELSSILPEFNKILEGNSREPSSSLTGNEPLSATPPSIPGVLGDDLINDGITVNRPGKDMGLVMRFVGGLNEAARLMDQQGHPLGPVLRSFTGLISDTVKAIASKSLDINKDFIGNAQRLVSKDEWTNQVVPLMENKEIDPLNPATRPANTPDNIWQAYSTARRLDETMRQGIIQANRRYLQLNGVDPAKAAEYYPDNWGMPQGHYPHIYQGSYAITELTGTDPETGRETWSPIPHEDGWRASSKFEANRKAADYKEANPQSGPLRVQQDQSSLPGKGISDRAKLKEIAKDIKAGTTAISNGIDPEDVLKELYETTGAAAYGPLRIAKRGFGPTSLRETDLPGYAKDIDSYRQYLLQGQRYIELVQARPLLMKTRNAIAELGGFKPIQSLTEAPTLKFNGNGQQYGNLLARMDSSLEGLEGYSGASENAIKGILNKYGFDPQLYNRASGAFQQISALIKLGLSPVRILSHGLQTLTNVFPVLREHTAEGLAHAYDPKYDWLIKDLAVPHGANLSDLEGVRSYTGQYFGKGSTPIDWTKGTGAIIQQLGLSPFTTGISFTRRVAAIGAYIKAIDGGMAPELARNYARDILDRTTGMYSPADNPPVLRQLPAAVAQFKSFMPKQIQFILGLRGLEIPAFVAAMSVLGPAALPFINGLGSLVQYATGSNPVDEAKRAWPKLTRGVFGAAGVDIPRSVGFQEFGSPRSGGVAGPGLSDAGRFAAALTERLKGPSRKADQDLDAAFQQLSPEGRAIFNEGMRLAGRPGTVDPRTGNINIKQLSPTERVELIAGLTPLKIAQELSTHENIRNKTTQYQDKRGFYVDKLAQISVGLSDPKLSDSDRAELNLQLFQTQREAQSEGVGSNLALAVKERARAMQLDRLQRDLKQAPKALRPQLRGELGSQ